MNLTQIERHLKSLADPQIATQTAKFFKTAKGEYAEGDCFLGIKVPVLRQHLKLAEGLTFPEIAGLLKSPWHEIRHFAVLLLVKRFKEDALGREKIYRFYLANSHLINNWDLVDASAHKIVGAYLFNKEKNELYHLATSSNLWQRRIAMVTCWHFTQNNDFTDTFKIAEMLLADSDDLIHKAVGWMLREVGKRDQIALSDFLISHYRKLSRTTLRYAIEHFEESQRQAMLNLKVEQR